MEYEASKNCNSQVLLFPFKILSNNFKATRNAIRNIGVGSKKKSAIYHPSEFILKNLKYL